MKKELASKIFLLGLVSVLLMSVVSAETTFDRIWNNGGGFLSGVGNFISHPGNFGGNQLAEGVVVQWLLFFLVVMIVYAISAAIPFLGGQRSWALKSAVSIVIGILAIFFLKPEEILTILQTYKTLGIALTVIVPFFVIAVVQKDLMETGHSVLGKFVWILFLGTLMVRYLTASTDEIGNFGLWAFWVVAALSLIMLIWEARIYLYFFKKEMAEAGSLHDKLVVARLVADVNKLEEQMESSDDAEAQQVLATRYNKLLDDLKARGVNYSKKK